MNVKERRDYHTWLVRIRQLALRVEWILDEDGEEFWLPKFRAGMTPEAALEEYWKIVRGEK